MDNAHRHDVAAVSTIFPTRPVHTQSPRLKDWHPTHYDASNVIAIDIKAAKESLPSFFRGITQCKAIKSHDLFIQRMVLTLINASRNSVRNDSRAPC